VRVGARKSAASGLPLSFARGAGVERLTDASAEKRLVSDKLQKLCQGVEAISPQAEIKFVPSSSDQGKWSVVVAVGDAILVYTEYAAIDDAIAQALKKLAAISTRMLAAVRRKSEPPPGST